MKAENGSIKWLLKITVTVILISADYYHFQPKKVQYPEGSWVCLDDEKLPYSTSENWYLIFYQMQNQIYVNQRSLLVVIWFEYVMLVVLYPARGSPLNMFKPIKNHQWLFISLAFQFKSDWRNRSNFWSAKSKRDQALHVSVLFTCLSWKKTFICMDMLAV